MGWFSNGMDEYMNACRERQGFLQSQEQWLNDESAKYQESAEQFQKTRDRIRQETVGYLLPEVSDGYLQELEKKLSYPMLIATKREYDAEFQQVEKRRIELEASDDIKNYDFNLYQIDDVLNGLTPGYEAATKRKNLWEDCSYFKNLSQRNYFTPEGSKGWWNAILNWRDVSLLMSRLRKGGEIYSNPTNVRDAYRLFADQADEVIKAYDRKQHEKNRLVGLKDELQRLRKEPENLLARLYQKLSEMILEHLEIAPEEVRLQMAKQDPYLDTFFRKALGTQKQIKYLKELAVVRIDSQREQLRQELSKLKEKISKLELQKRRGKRKVFNQAQIAQMRDVKADKWAKRRSQIGEVRTRIVTFDNYNNGSLLERYLWWDLMTRGMHGHDIYEVRHFHETNPGWNYKDHLEGNAVDENGLDNAAESLAASMSTPTDESFQDAT